MQFQPGQSGNPAGAPLGVPKKPKRWKAALERALAHIAPGDDIGIDGGLYRIAKTVVAAALAGDKDAWREIGDRLDGKVPQGVGGADDLPAQRHIHEFVDRIVDPRDPSTASVQAAVAAGPLQGS